MFDIGFSELLLVMVIGLVVLGPERLPVAVKTVVGWIRTLRSLASTVQNELSQELKLQELQDSLKKVEKASLQNLSPELKASMDELKEAAEAMKRGYAEKSPSGEGDAQEPLSYQPLNDPEAVHDGVIDTEKAPPPAVANQQPESEGMASAPRADNKIKPEPAPAISPHQPSDDR
ncbi:MULTISPECIES: Sec-independent protein translocase protein TatB [Brenneria]|uniref:Sec-independent protein translocase protein TatB n=1 Tax=Brenneria nigrifluens DSM 30175 = ATCC 13028 TaxID=1121120 RepID=A0A2U1UNT1_9GAMM|nr:MULTISPECIES: Sec-independent protein translocase protein TatB [Brenneria]EHD19673.1 Sec-independent protein translocase protein tatB-like protein [Brenneria sp. EniD312]PWC23232.1 twin-arginine translocase subunit TatB [Brenneria nigrifluens DSM 30175 = ATCC 13028]QCR02936.1 Sec-independent protein translocase subunit TatB [Brenneria nigrifluens DSM 30175 = ATCC 13028]